MVFRFPLLRRKDAVPDLSYSFRAYHVLNEYETRVLDEYNITKIDYETGIVPDTLMKYIVEEDEYDNDIFGRISFEGYEVLKHQNPLMAWHFATRKFAKERCIYCAIPTFQLKGHDECGCAIGDAEAFATQGQHAHSWLNLPPVDSCQMQLLLHGMAIKFDITTRDMNLEADRRSGLVSGINFDADEVPDLQGNIYRWPIMMLTRCRKWQDLSKIDYKGAVDEFKEFAKKFTCEGCRPIYSVSACHTCRFSDDLKYCHIAAL